jgi:hypothetical protein
VKGVTVAQAPRKGYGLAKGLAKEHPMIIARIFSLLLSVGLLSACAGQNVVEAPVALGDFKMGHNIVVADNPQKVPISREANPQDLDDSLTKAIQERLGRYDGDKFYNLGVSIDAYALAPPGIPLVLSPKSALVVTATIWDDAAGKKLNEEGMQFTVFEGIDGETMLGSGLTRTAQEQMDKLSFNAAKRIERWLSDNPQWFGLPPKPPAPAASSK